MRNLAVRTEHARRNRRWRWIWCLGLLLPALAAAGLRLEVGKVRQRKDGDREARVAMHLDFGRGSNSASFNQADVKQAFDGAVGALCNGQGGTLVSYKDDGGGPSRKGFVVRYRVIARCE